jgi:hypothetical protein
MAATGMAATGMAAATAITMGMAATGIAVPTITRRAKAKEEILTTIMPMAEMAMVMITLIIMAEMATKKTTATAKEATEAKGPVMVKKATAAAISPPVYLLGVAKRT